MGWTELAFRAYGSATESTLATLAEFKNAKVLRVRNFLDHQGALDAGVLSMYPFG